MQPQNSNDWNTTGQQPAGPQYPNQQFASGGNWDSQGGFTSPAYYGAPNNPGGFAGQGAPKSKKTGWGKGLVVMGVIVLLLAIAAGVAGAMNTMKISDELAESEGYAGNVSAQLQLNDGDRRTVWVDSETSSCTVNTAPLEKPSSTITVGSNDGTFYRAGTIEAENQGNYAISCNTPFVISSFDGAGGVVGGVFGIIGAVFLGLFSVLLLVVGAIMWALGARYNKQNRQNQYNSQYNQAW